MTDRELEFDNRDDSGILRLTQVVNGLLSQIDRIESAVSSTDRNVQLMTAKLDEFISQSERRRFLDNPSAWTDGDSFRTGGKFGDGLFPG